MNYSVLVVEDDKLINEFLVETLKRAGYDCEAVFSAEDALVLFKQKEFDVILSDYKMGEMDGIQLLKHIKNINKNTAFIIMTAFGTVPMAVKATKLGAYDFLIKPVLPETIEHIMTRVTEMLNLKQENATMRQELSDKFQNIIGKSKVMKEIFELIQSVASARSTVMITGTTGTGKEMIARAIHYASNRKDKPFIKLNCAALPENLVEAELFGYEKGAFTDAKKTNRGRFELADGGTLLLDEISEMPLNLQSKLLRVLQEREFERIGSSNTISVDVRIIATSNRNLKEYITQGKFREDLYYRLNVIPIHLCPLRERTVDIPLLAQHFVEKYNKENGRNIKGIDQTAMNLFMKYPWNGNVRELENLIEGAVVMSKNDILTDEDFPIEMAIGQAPNEEKGLQLPMTIEEGTKYLIIKTLALCNGNKTDAADKLGITPRTIRNKLFEYNMVEN